jgi:hypothetical protein
MILSEGVEHGLPDISWSKHTKTENFCRINTHYTKLPQHMYIQTYTVFMTLEFQPSKWRDLKYLTTF